jgi:hypothetical protein
MPKKKILKKPGKQQSKNEIREINNFKKKKRNKKILVKVANLYCNQELIMMATNLYYHCWLVGARL